MASYRKKLSTIYEDKLEELGLSANVLAYRRILKGDGRGKSNIDFAHDAFSAIRCAGSCLVLAFDLSDFFGSLRHDRIERLWKWLLKVDRLPIDHFKVLQHVTRYSYVDLDRAYLALGIKGDVTQRDGNQRTGYLKHRKDVKPQLCFPDEFRAEIAKKGLICTWKDRGKPDAGIPQGLPMSDLLANLYMVSFDALARRYANKLGGSYLRYSDDILFILPEGTDHLRAMRWVNRAIEILAPGLRFNRDKTEVGRYQQGASGQTYHKTLGGEDGGLNYLGFRYDGHRVYLRNRTISGFRRTFARYAKVAAWKSARRYANKTAGEILAVVPLHRIMEKVGKVENFHLRGYDKRAWTFHTYARRADKAFSTFGSGIMRQMRKNEDSCRAKLAEAVQAVVKTRDNPESGKTRKV